MTDAINAYRAQIEAADLPITNMTSDGGWTTISFRHEFVFITLSVPDDTPSYCRLEAGFSLEQSSEDERMALLIRANANSERKRIAKTVVELQSEGSFVKFSCEFFADEEASFTIKPSLSRYLSLLSGAAETFNKDVPFNSAEPEQ